MTDHHPGTPDLPRPLRASAGTRPPVQSPHGPPPPGHPAPGSLPTRPPGPFAVGVARFWAAHRRPAPPRALLTTGATGVAAAVLVPGRPPGLGVAVVGALVWVAALPALRRRGRVTVDAVLVGLCVALVAVAAVRDAGWVVALCLLIAGGVAAVASTAARTAPAVLLAVPASALASVRAVRWLSHAAGTLAGTRRTQVLAVARSIGVTVALLAVFGLLFASADQVFASLLPRVDPGLLPVQVVVGGTVALVSATLAHLALAPPPWSDVVHSAPRPVRRGEWLLPVGSLAALVLGFVLVQVGALLGGHRYVLRTAGLEYAEYARQGFGQLVVVTALTLVVVAVAARRAPRATATDRLVSRAALGVLCLGTLGVVASALRRMDLYVDAFGLTRLRILATITEVVLGVVLVLVLAAGVRWRAAWLPRAVVVTVALAALALAAVNPDAQIVRHNTAATSDVDVAYLRALSSDAVPAVARLDEPLRSCLLDAVLLGPDGSPGIGPDGTPDGLLGWNLGRDRAARVLADAGPVGSTACGVTDPSRDLGD